MRDKIPSGALPAIRSATDREPRSASTLPSSTHGSSGAALTRKSAALRTMRQTGGGRRSHGTSKSGMSKELAAGLRGLSGSAFEQAGAEPEQRAGHPGGFDLRAAAGIVGDLARAEREAVLCVGRRRKWGDLEKYDEEINEAEQASAALQPCR